MLSLTLPAWTIRPVRAIVLREMEKGYAGFKRVLKPGGTLLICDADWHARLCAPVLYVESPLFEICARKAK